MPMQFGGGLNWTHPLLQQINRQGDIIQYADQAGRENERLGIQKKLFEQRLVDEARARELREAELSLRKQLAEADDARQDKLLGFKEKELNETGLRRQEELALKRLAMDQDRQQHGSRMSLERERIAAIERGNSRRGASGGGKEEIPPAVKLSFDLLKLKDTDELDPMMAMLMNQMAPGSADRYMEQQRKTGRGDLSPLRQLAAPIVTQYLQGKRGGPDQIEPTQQRGTLNDLTPESAAQYRGVTVEDEETGQRYKSDGKTWVPIGQPKNGNGLRPNLIAE